MKKKIALLLAASLTMMAGSTIAPCLPLIAENYADIPSADFLSKLVLTLPSISIVVFGLLISVLMSKIGRIKILYASLILYTLAGVSGYYLESIYTILIGRIIFGIAIAGVMTTTTTLIGDYFEGEERIRFTGFQSMFIAISGVAFAILGGVLAEIGWRAPFLVYLAAILVLIICIFSLNEPKLKSQADNSEKEEKLPKPIIKTVLISTLMAMMIFFVTPVQIPFLLEELSIDSTKLAGLAIACFTLGGAITSGLYVKVKRKLSHKNVYLLAFSVLGIAYLALGFVESYSLVMACLFLGGLGGGFMLPNGTIWLLSVIPEKKRGMIMGLLTVVIFLGQFLSPILVQPIVNYGGQAVSFTFVGILSLTVGATFLFVRKTTRLN